MRRVLRLMLDPDRMLEPLRVSAVKNYLGFVRNAGGLARAHRFDAAVASLKKTGDWQRIHDAYRR